MNNFNMRSEINIGPIKREMITLLLTWGKFQETDSGKLQTSWPIMRAQQARLVHFYQHVLPKNSWYWVCFHVKGAAARWRRERCSNGKEVSCPRGIWSHLRWAVSRLDAFHLLRCEKAPQGASSVFQPFRRRMTIFLQWYSAHENVFIEMNQNLNWNLLSTDQLDAVFK